MQKYKAKVSSHELLAGSFQYLHFELISPDRIDFQAGQYIIFNIDASRGLHRDYSIASQPSMNHAIELLVDIKPGGPGSEFLKKLQAGNEVEFIGPFGNFVVKEECSMLNAQRSTHQLLFVATGSGISPIRSMILDLLLVKKYQGQIKLWWGMRNQEDCFWSEDFDELEKNYPNFKWDLVLSNPPDNWPLHSGHVTQHVLDYIQKQIPNTEYRIPNKILHKVESSHSEFPARNATLSVAGGSIQHSEFCIYLCGNRFMIDEVSTKLKELGINTGHIHTEKFF
ncbi:hypothetical protein HZB78_05735 [Candidatus Collierbacteria bacterium]|nr:hypothetical protein [Candidatus Collierbacteria bacterium]